MFVTIPVKSYSKKELAAMYEIHPNTLRAWFERNPALAMLIGTRRRLTPKEVKIIFIELGEPEKENGEL